MGSLGRKIPTDWQHVEKHPLVALPHTVTTVERTLVLPTWHWTHNQGAEGSCVGHGSSMMMSLLNRRRYNPLWLWNESKKIDEWPDTNPGDDEGTSVRASCDVLRTLGHAHARLIKEADWNSPPVFQNFSGLKILEGISQNQWATSVDQIRSSLSAGIPVSIGVNWYDNFDNPEYKNGWYWIGLGDLGSIRGGHCVCLYGASDKRQAFRLKNSWGKGYHLTWLPYTVMDRLLDEYGEATLVTDRI